MRKTIGEMANIDGWLGNDVPLSLLYSGEYEENMMDIRRQKNADLLSLSIPENRV